MVPVRHGLSFLALAGLVVSGCAAGGGGGAAAHPSKGWTAADYFPLQVGWKWAYDLEKDGEKILAVYAVVERAADSAVVQAGDERLTYAVTPDGIAQKTTDGPGLGDFLLRNPVAVGSQWPVASGTAKVVSTTQEVSVEAGHFADCAVVEATRSEPVRVARTTFAPEVGWVMLEVQVQDGSRFVTTTRATLRSVTKPGEDLFH
jgi:hypothetical protein